MLPIPTDPTDRTAYREAVATVAAKAHAKLPECRGRIDSAVKLVLLGEVILHPDGTVSVGSCSDPTRVYAVNGHCDCKDYEHAPANMCKHRLAAGIAKRVQELLPAPVRDEDDGWPPDEADRVEPPPLGIDPRFMVRIQGKPFVQYAGLLALAHERGLVSLTARIESSTETLALASATATFQDGRTFTEWADATPENVGAKVRPHWIRMSLTRAKGRALRDALNIGLCTVEELGD